jgi:uncharacterized protein (DUF1501 family)
MGIEPEPSLLIRRPHRYNALDGVSTTESFSSAKMGTQLHQVSRLIKTNKENIGNKRDIFYVYLGGFDTHSNLHDGLKGLLDDVDDAVGDFKREMKAQGMWDNVALVSVSDFARTLTSNGVGTDHAWGGNHFITGGSVNGGKIFGYVRARHSPPLTFSPYPSLVLAACTGSSWRTTPTTDP